MIHSQSNPQKSSSKFTNEEFRSFFIRLAKIIKKLDDHSKKDHNDDA